MNEEAKKRRYIRRIYEITSHLKETSDLNLARSTLGDFWHCLSVFIMSPAGESNFSFRWVKSGRKENLILGLFNGEEVLHIVAKITFNGLCFVMGSFKPEGTGSGFMIDMMATYRGDFVEWRLNGHGQYNRHDGILFEGEFNNGNKEGKGKMTWPDGFIIDGYWSEDVLKSKKKHIHPTIQKAIDEGRCTNEEITKNRLLPQAMHDCWDSRDYCMSCVKKGCHPCREDQMFWDWNSTSSFVLCACPREECNPMIKKRKIDQIETE
eukprot:TRINITY_DN1949_c0_g1_i2.p1 TRINITY_DN1949_c0_g1~~TRINITY_DN1949_c0_g1_i2.p1  ORF type:complete len:307 (-),score=41.14 TRINITY_DN1949_c0_g1_i2:54-848(-)